MITSPSLPSSEAGNSASCAAAIELLADDELDRLAASWRLQALGGGKEAFSPAHSLEVAQRQRRTPAPGMVSPSLRTMVTSRSWWRFWGGSEAGQTESFS